MFVILGKIILNYNLVFERILKFDIFEIIFLIYTSNDFLTIEYVKGKIT